MAKSLTADFSQESNIKENLFFMMTSKYNEMHKNPTVPLREEVSFESLSPHKKQVKTLSAIDNKENTIKPPSK